MAPIYIVALMLMLGGGVAAMKTGMQMDDVDNASDIHAYQVGHHKDRIDPDCAGDHLFLSNEKNPDNMYLDCVEHAKDSLMAVIYKFSQKDLYEALKTKLTKHPDLKLRIIINDDTVKHKHKQWLEKLEDIGKDVKVRYWKQVKHSSYNKLHAKFAVCDEHVGYFGSANWSKNSADNMEILARTVNPNTVDRLQYLFDQLWHDDHASKHA